MTPYNQSYGLVTSLSAVAGNHQSPGCISFQLAGSSYKCLDSVNHFKGGDNSTPWPLTSTILMRLCK